MPTLQAIRRRFALHKLRKYRQITAGIQASPPSGSYVGVANGTEATRRVVSSDLASLDAAGVSPQARVARYNGWYAWVLAATPEQRAIATNGLTSSIDASEVTDQAASDVLVGYLTLDRTLGAAVPAGTTVELHAHPVLDRDVPGLHTLINQALGQMETIRRISITGVSNQWEYDLSAYTFLTKQARLRQLVGPLTTGSTELPYAYPGGGELRFDGERPYLTLGATASTGQTFWLDVSVPRSSWIKVGSTWAASTVGLVNETDEAAGDIDEICAVAWYFYTDLMVGADPNLKLDPWLARRAAALEAAAPLMLYGQPEAVEPFLESNALDSPAFLARRPHGRAGRRAGFGIGWP